MIADFNQCKYSPLVRSRRAELLGYKNLESEIKSAILPAFILGKWPKSDDIRDSMAECIKAGNGQCPFIIDTTRLLEHRGQQGEGFTVHDLVNPDDDFKAWRDFLAEFKEKASFIPAVQFHVKAKPRNIIQQSLLLEETYEQIAFRVTATKNKQLDIVVYALGAMNDPKNAVIYVDLGFITEGNMPAQERAAIIAINSLRAAESKANIVLCGSSFPGSVVYHGRESGVIPILERHIHREIGGQDVAIYGDYSSIHPEIGPTAYGYVPRIDYPTPEDWRYFREQAQTKSDGYINCEKNNGTWGMEPKFNGLGFCRN